MSDYKRNPRSARRARKSLSRKALVVLSLMMVLVLAAVGGTLAWLVDDTDPVVNTFATAGIDIELTENMDADGKWTMQMIPGTSKAKNPVVKVNRPETDVDIWLFVKFEETVDENVLTYTSTLTIANGWTALENVDNVWYRRVNANDPKIEWHLLENDIVSVSGNVTKNQIPDNAGTMTYTAYACQVANGTSEFTPAEAWEILNPNPGT